LRAVSRITCVNRGRVVASWRIYRRCEGLFAEVVLEIHKLRTGNKHHDGYCRDDTEQEVHLSALG